MDHPAPAPARNALGEPGAIDRRDHRLRPLLIAAAAAHRDGQVRYLADGTAEVRHPGLPARGLGEVVRVPPARQYPLVAASFADLDKSLAQPPISPRLDDGRSLRERFDEERARYAHLQAEAAGRGAIEPDYGTYVLDHRAEELYLVAPEPWHRVGLVASNARLLADPAGALSWSAIRERLESAVVGFAGVSVGGNVLEGWLREARPRAVKIADPDWVELTNLNRGERMSLRHVAASRAAARRADGGRPARVPKAEYAAYEAQLVDPYLDAYVYAGGLTDDNLGTFLGGDGAGEPPIDILVEEMDHLELKVRAREAARERGVDVVMVSDFGHRVDLLWNHFREQPGSRLGIGGSDDDLRRAMARARSEGRPGFFAFVEALCGPDFASDTFAAFIAGEGDQPTRSMAQSGGTAMAAGAIGGKEVALRVLGHHRGEPSPRRVVYDLLGRRVLTDS